MNIHNHTLPKAIRRHSIRRWLATATTMTAMLTATLATLTGCSADNDPETAIGGDGTSVTFGATIAAREGHDNGNAPASRAIPDGTFEEGDQILVHMDGKLKAFVYSTARGFVHDPSNKGANVDPTPPVWQDGEAEKSLLAYGPTACISSAGDGAFLYEVYVSAAQNDDREYKYSDYVYTAQTLYRSNPALSFRHGMARVVLRLRSGGSLTDEDVVGASVLLGDKNLFTRADIDPQNGTLTAHKPEPNGLQPQTITPHRCADTPTGYVVAYEALMPPQDVSGKAFIKVRLSDGTELGHMAASGSMLKGGHEYVYNVTVEANRLAVTVTGSDVPWQDGILTTKIDKKEFRLIRTAEDLARFARDVNGDGVTGNTAQTELNALQTADIDLQDLARSAHPDLQKLAEDWVPIGSKVGVYAPTYEGIYCGNGYTISGLRIKSNHGTGNNGLFGSITGNALLTGIHLRDVRITGTTGLCTGALAGYVHSGTVTLCSAEGTIEATLSGSSARFGGLVGESDGCSINRCRTKVNIKADVTLKGDGWAYAGGIVGDNREASTLFACQSEGEVSLTGAGTSTDTQALCAGGIAGRNSYASEPNDSYIQACMATGNVSVTYTGTDAVNAYAGGLVGYNKDRGYLQYSYARGTATAATTGSKAKGYAGAIIGGYNNDRNTNLCFGAGNGGAGTSGLEAASGDIVYNRSPGEREIRNVIVQSGINYPVSTTLYDASATPAYGISVSGWRMHLDNIWLTTDPTWPALDMEYNGY
ncbi:fimbrillin family protein [Bacteroides stercorirosoris]|uniref:Fimbrillin-like n=2 Tax=Bacteroides stercorirosoris TaxID=871324 RepID=A0A1M6BZW4_9BACE|nr:fimbrillin family protein [Bacteroides stercorirosoris]SHI54359.1 Fimbrillin-like [Bacteroides stercorirosoris]